MTTTAYASWSNEGGLLQSPNVWFASQVASRLQYKPGWVIEVASNYPLTAGPGTEAICLIHAETLDSNTGEPFYLDHSMPLHCFDLNDEREVLRAILRCVVAVETHEAMEFLCFDGERVTDPHAEGTVLYHVPVSA